MRISTVLIFISLLLTTTVKAGVFTTLPFGSTKWVTGQNEVIQWKDDEANPALASLKKLQVDLYSGNDTSQQTFVKNIANNVNGNVRKLNYTVPNDVVTGQYFIKYTEGTTYQQSSGVFLITSTTSITSSPTAPGATDAYGNNPAAITGPTPAATPAATSAATPAATTGTNANINTASASNQTPTPTPLSSSSSIVHINDLILGSLIILSTLSLKYL